jgi:cation diffusion facilitator family transporter
MADSDRTIYVAMVANLTIATSQFAAAAFTGSASMVAEGIHSLVDTANCGLLLLGRHASHREPDETHPFGYGKEQYFWTLIVAVMIFALGGSLTIYQGVHRLLNPSEIEHPIWNCAVLLVAAILTGCSWVVAFCQLREAHPNLGLFQATHASKNPSDFVVVVEDTAAFLGVVIAFLGIILSHLLGHSLPDGVASVIIGLLLAAIAIFLVYESKEQDAPRGRERRSGVGGEHPQAGRG